MRSSSPAAIAAAALLAAVAAPLRAADCGASAVFADIADAGRFAAADPRLEKAFDFLRGPVPATLKPGDRFEIDGSNCWAFVCDVELKPPAGELLFEAHRAFIDILAPLTGPETYGFTRTPETALAAFDEAKDITLFRGSGETRRLEPGQFAMFLPPYGAHAPGLSGDGPRTTRRLVVKVRASSVVERHAAVARRAAADGIVLLKNDGTLPLARGSSVALFGAVDGLKPGGGGSSGVRAIRTVSLREGLEEAGFAIDQESRDAAVFVVAREALEGEDSPDGDFYLSEDELAELGRIKAAGFAKIVVLCCGGHAFDLGPFAKDDKVGAVLFAWYPGGEGGAAVGDVLSGKVNPSGRLAETFAARVADYPTDAGFRESRWYVPYEEGIFVGYRYFETIPGAKEKVVYPFGHGLSYTTWKIEPVAPLSQGACQNLNVRVRVTNTGSVPGRRSVLCYTSQTGGVAEHPAIELRAFAKTSLLAPGASEELDLSFSRDDLAYFDDDEASPTVGSWVVDRGAYKILVGGSVRDVAEAASFEVPEPVVISSPGLKLQADRLARQLRADGTYRDLPVEYPGHREAADLTPVRTNATADVKATLFDVADGKATLDDFLDQMSLQEMLHLLFGHLREDPCGTGSIGALAKFGIPAVQTCDGPAGVRREAASTFFPCAALLACTFDHAILREIGGVIGDEAAEAGFDVLLAPGLNIHRHPLCGRNFEYFGEDPLVSGVCAGEYVKGVQSRGVGATVKHFAGNGRETTRRIQKDVVSERAFREIYLRGFERAMKGAGPWAVMTSYNGVNGYNAGENHGLVTGILRDEWGYGGVTMTDWLTTIPMWREIGAGNDLKMPKDIEDTQRDMMPRGGAVDEALFAYRRRYLSLSRVRESAKRVLSLVMKTRRFAREKAARDSGRPLAANPDYDRRPPAPGVKIVLELRPGPDNPRNSEGAFMPLKDGRIMFAYTRYYGSSGHDHATADIVARYSSDMGATWSNEDEMLFKNHGGMNVMSVSLLRLASGEIAAFYLVKESEDDCRPVMRRSFDEGRTWTDPVLCITDDVAYWVLNNDRVIQLRDGRLLMAVARHEFPGGVFDNVGAVTTYLSDDNGATWRRGGPLIEVRAPNGRRFSAQEPGVVELKDGRVLLWMRTDAGSQYMCLSSDGGETWTSPKPSWLVSPRSPASIKRLPAGDLLAIWNDHTGLSIGKARTPLASAVSRDEGETWGGVRLIENDPGGRFCYTAIQPAGDGSMLLAYCAYDALGHTRIVKVPLEWFYGNLEKGEQKKKGGVDVDSL